MLVIVPGTDICSNHFSYILTFLLQEQRNTVNRSLPIMFMLLSHSMKNLSKWDDSALIWSPKFATKSVALFTIVFRENEIDWKNFTCPWQTISSALIRHFLIKSLLVRCFVCLVINSDKKYFACIAASLSYNILLYIKCYFFTPNLSSFNFSSLINTL